MIFWIELIQCEQNNLDDFETQTAIVRSWQNLTFFTSWVECKRKLSLAYTHLFLAKQWEDRQQSFYSLKSSGLCVKFEARGIIWFFIFWWGNARSRLWRVQAKRYNYWKSIECLSWSDQNHIAGIMIRWSSPLIKCWKWSRWANLKMSWSSIDDNL